MNKSRKALLVGGAAVVSLIFASPVLADTATSSTPASHTTGTALKHRIVGTAVHKPMVSGTVTAITGNSITLLGKNGTTYTVDATNAKVIKNKVTITVSAIAVGDTLVVSGTTTGSSVVATGIRDGVVSSVKKTGTKPINAKAEMPFGKNATFGTVASVSGSTFTLTKKSGTGTTTVMVTTDTTTVFKKNGQTDTLADVAAGQTVVVMGAKDTSGNVTATSVNVMVPHEKKTTK